MQMDLSQFQKTTVSQEKCSFEIKQQNWIALCPYSRNQKTENQGLKKGGYSKPATIF